MCGVCGWLECGVEWGGFNKFFSSQQELGLICCFNSFYCCFNSFYSFSVMNPSNQKAIGDRSFLERIEATNSDLQWTSIAKLFCRSWALTWETGSRDAGRDDAIQRTTRCGEGLHAVPASKKNFMCFYLRAAISDSLFDWMHLRKRNSYRELKQPNWDWNRLLKYRFLPSSCDLGLPFDWIH